MIEEGKERRREREGERKRMREVVERVPAAVKLYSKMALSAAFAPVLSTRIDTLSSLTSCVIAA